MGRFDSTKTRVTPVFDELIDRDDHTDWLAKLLALPNRKGATDERLASPPIINAYWGDDEISLAAPISLLRFLVNNPKRLSTPIGFEEQAESTKKKRLGLLQGDATIAEEALTLLGSRKTHTRGWYVLEGPSRPDVFLETDDAIIVIEGKRTEPSHTKSTSWLATRHQMLRHIDCAWELRNGRRVYGFFIVEGDPDAVPAAWQASCDDTIALATLEKSLPHRTNTERSAIAEAFLGATSWQAMSNTFGIILPHD